MKLSILILLSSQTWKQLVIDEIKKNKDHLLKEHPDFTKTLFAKIKVFKDSYEIEKEKATPKQRAAMNNLLEFIKEIEEQFPQ